MNRAKWKNRLVGAMQEPSVPEELMERSIVLARALKAGREAEEKLMQAGETLTKEEKETLAAQSLLGRLMHSSLPPKGASVEKLIADLRSREDVQAALKKPTGELLSELKSGKLIRSLAAKERTRMKKKTNGKTLGEKQAKEKKTPVKEAPEKGILHI